MEPDAQLAGELEAGQGLPVTAALLMGGSVAELAQLVEDIGRLPGNGPLEPKTPQRLLERLALADIKGVMRGDQVGDKFGELAQLEQAGGGVVPEVPLGQTAELHQLGVVRAQKVEIRGLHKNQPLPSRRNCIIWDAFV